MGTRPMLWTQLSGRTTVMLLLLLSLLSGVRRAGGVELTTSCSKPNRRVESSAEFATMGWAHKKNDDSCNLMSFSASCIKAQLGESAIRSIKPPQATFTLLAGGWQAKEMPLGRYICRGGIDCHVLSDTSEHPPHQTIDAHVLPVQSLLGADGIRSWNEYLVRNKLSLLPASTQRVLVHMEHPQRYRLTAHALDDVGIIISPFSPKAISPSLMVTHIPVSYINVPEHAFTSPSSTFEDRTASVPVFVSHCGVRFRDDIVDAFMKDPRVAVNSYGSCKNNAQVGSRCKGRSRPSAMNDHIKECVLRGARVTLAIENSIADDYISEKLWQPLAAGAVPVYIGAKNVRKYLPAPEAVVTLDDFNGSVPLLIEYISKLTSDAALWNIHTAWRKNATSSPHGGFCFAMKHSWGSMYCNVCNSLAKDSKKRKNTTAKELTNKCRQCNTAEDSASEFCAECHIAKMELQDELTNAQDARLSLIEKSGQLRHMRSRERLRFTNKKRSLDMQMAQLQFKIQGGESGGSFAPMRAYRTEREVCRERSCNDPTVISGRAELLNASNFLHEGGPVVSPHLGVDAMYVTHYPKLKQRKLALDKNLREELGPSAATWIVGLNKEDIYSRGVNTSLVRRQAHFESTQAEISLMLKHFAAYFHMLEHDFKKVLVFEDDVAFTKGMWGKRGRAAQLIRGANPDQFDAIFVAGCGDSGSVGVDAVDRRYSCMKQSETRIVKAKEARCSAGYLISRKGAEKMIAGVPIHLHSDIAMSKLLDEISWVCPPPATQNRASFEHSLGSRDD